MLLAALCWAASIVYLRAHRWATPPFELALWQALLAGMALIVGGIAAGVVERRA